MAGKGVGDAFGPIKTGINVGQKISEILFPQTKQVLFFGRVIQLCFVVMVKNFILKKEIP